MAERVGFARARDRPAACRGVTEDSRNATSETKLSEWRRGWDSNPRAGYPTTRFRGAPVTTTSVPLRVEQREADP
jgi:hypothetical protein